MNISFTFTMIQASCMMLLLCGIPVLLLASQVSESSNALGGIPYNGTGCPPSFSLDVLSSRCYSRLSDWRLTYEAATEWCQSLGGELPILETANDLEFFMERAPQSRYLHTYWLRHMGYVCHDTYQYEVDYNVYYVANRTNKVPSFTCQFNPIRSHDSHRKWNEEKENSSSESFAICQAQPFGLKPDICHTLSKIAQYNCGELVFSGNDYPVNSMFNCNFLPDDGQWNIAISNFSCDRSAANHLLFGELLLCGSSVNFSGRMSGAGLRSVFGVFVNVNQHAHITYKKRPINSTVIDLRLPMPKINDRRCPTAEVKKKRRFTKYITYKFQSTVQDSFFHCEFKQRGRWNIRLWFNTTDKQLQCGDTYFSFNNETVVRGDGYVSAHLSKPKLQVFAPSGCFVNFSLTLSQFKDYNVQPYYDLHLTTKQVIMGPKASISPAAKGVTPASLSQRNYNTHIDYDLHSITEQVIKTTSVPKTSVSPAAKALVVNATGCPPSFSLDVLSNRCYSRLSDRWLTYEAAREWCQSLGGEIPVVETANDVAYFMDRAPQSRYLYGYWIRYMGTIHNPTYEYGYNYRVFYVSESSNNGVTTFRIIFIPRRSHSSDRKWNGHRPLSRRAFESFAVCQAQILEPKQEVQVSHGKQEYSFKGKVAHPFLLHGSTVAIIALGCAGVVLIAATVLATIIIRRISRSRSLKLTLDNAFEKSNVQKSLSNETVTGKTDKTFGVEKSDLKRLLFKDNQEADTKCENGFGAEHHA